MNSAVDNVRDRIKLIDLHFKSYTETDWITLEMMGGHIINGAHFGDLINFTFMAGPSQHYIINYVYTKGHGSFSFRIF